MAQAAKSAEKVLKSEANKKPAFLPMILIIFAAKKENTAMPTIIKEVGTVCNALTGLKVLPIIPLKKTLIGAGVKLKI